MFRMDPLVTNSMVSSNITKTKQKICKHIQHVIQTFNKYQAGLLFSQNQSER